MAVRIGVPRETATGETRVALVPAVAEKYAALGAEVLVERAAGQLSHIRDEEFAAATLVDGAADVFAADVVLKVDPPSPEEVAQMREGTVVLGLLQPYKADDSIKALRDGKITSFSLELLPRITRAQSMDALTSQASIAGYKAVLMSACMAGRYYPMLTTPAGTLRPAKVLVLGVGVAGLQAIATARRLGAVVEAYDVRSVTREQVQSLGGRFIDTGIDAEIEGGYARELTDEEKAKAKEIVDGHIVEADAVITTAAIPGRPSPKLITADVVDRMKPGAVIIDMAAEGGGNCELTRPGEQYNHPNGVFIYGPLNIPGMLPVHASDQYARNLMHFLTPFIKDGELQLDWDDEVLAGSVLTRDGAIVNEQARERIEGPGAPAPADPDQATQEVDAEGEADENIPASPDAPEARDEARREAEAGSGTAAAAGAAGGQAGGGTQPEPPEEAPGEGPGHTDVPGEGEPAHDAPEPPDDAPDEEGGAR
jgi:NAD(P) transhydrogenase subunit alpha